MSTTSTTMRSVSFTRFGGVEVLDFERSDVPRPGPGEVLVEVIAAGINHLEAFVRQGRPVGGSPVSLPSGQGSDFAGIVRAVGHGVTDVKLRAEVVGHAVRSSHADYVIVPATWVVAKPRDLGWEVAGALYLAGVTAAETIDGLAVGPDDTVVVSAAAGGVGSIETQLARQRGARVIGTCGERNFDYLRQQGVKPVVYGDGAADRIRELAPDGVTVFVDNFGQDGADLAERLGVDPTRYRSSDDRKAIELAAADPDDDFAATCHRHLEMLVDLAARRAITVLISGYYPLDLVRDAFDDLERLHARGKIVLGTHPANSERIRKARDVDEQRG